LKLNQLTAKTVSNAREGKHTDGGGLQYQVKGGSKRWVLRYRWQGRDKEIGIGTYPDMGLAAARAKRDEIREWIDNGRDPVSGVQSGSVTFRADMENFVEHYRREWRPSHHSEWLRMMNDKCAPLMDKPSGSITEADVLAIVNPMWETTNYTASRALDRITAVLGRARGLNPARFPAIDPCVRIRELLPRGARPAPVPMRPLPWRDLPQFYRAVSDATRIGARPLEFMLLTPCGRSTEYRKARWREIEGEIWNIPAGHTKSKLPRRVPLVPEAIVLLESIRPANATPDTFIFSGRLTPSFRRDGRVDRPSGMVGEGKMQELINHLGFECDVHGLRSTYSTWVIEREMFEFDRAKEIALDHKIGNAVYRAYQRSDLFDQRRKLSEIWVAFLKTPSPAPMAK
jgi:integrase